MTFTSLQSWLARLEQLHPREIDLGLERIQQVAERLGLLQPRCRVITVAGTNGKGSCVAAIAALLRAAGYKVGVYTSPHLLAYNERIALDTGLASDDEICAAFAAIENARDAISLTYFEFGTLAALDIFRQRQVDVMVLEVGLGGRLDAVNVIDPDIAVITSIDLDHEEWLGSTREKIGAEKAGIIRPGRPVVCADRQPPASVVLRAQELAAPWVALDHDYGYAQVDQDWHWWSKVGGTLTLTLPKPHLPLPSVAAALQVARLLGVDLTRIPAADVLMRLTLPGRFQRLWLKEREIILDVAHNPAASAYLSKRLASSPSSGRTHAMVAMMADKNRLASLRNLQARISSWYLADLGVSRAANVEQMADDLRQLGLEPCGQGSVQQCLFHLLEHTEPGDRILIWGSFYTVAAALSLLQTLDEGESA